MKIKDVRCKPSTCISFWSSKLDLIKFLHISWLVAKYWQFNHMTLTTTSEPRITSIKYPKGNSCKGITYMYTCQTNCPSKDQWLCNHLPPLCSPLKKPLTPQVPNPHSPLKDVALFPALTPLLLFLLDAWRDVTSHFLECQLLSSGPNHLKQYT